MLKVLQSFEGLGLAVGEEGNNISYVNRMYTHIHKYVHKYVYIIAYLYP